MPVQLTYPGVYVQELPIGVRTITGVSTSIALFIGRAGWGAHYNEVILCLNYSDFERRFSSDARINDLARAVKLFFLNGGSQCYVIRIAGANRQAASKEINQLKLTARYDGTFGNKIRANITYPDADNFDIEIFGEETVGATTRKKGLEKWRTLSMDPASDKFVETIVNSQWVTVNSLDPTNITRPTTGEYVLGDTPATVGRDGDDLLAEDYKPAYLLADREIDLFNLMVLPKDESISDMNALWGAACAFCGKKRAFLLMDPPGTWNNDDLINISADLGTMRGSLDPKSNSAVYFPQLTILENDNEVEVGPSGAIAGLMARIDSSRGVWKAPAGMEATIRGIRGLASRLTDEENGVLNPQGLNVLRVFPNGIVCWGARTNDGNDALASEWKYIPVRRTALFIEESLYRGLKWVVFEPNDETLWGQIRLNVGAFMHNLFMQGAFQGTKKSEAYFVRCDRETTTQNDINLGIVNIWVGFAPLKPAEFVIISLQQMAGQIEI